MTDQDALLAAVEEGRRLARDSGQPERTFRDTVQPALADALRELGIRRPGRNEVNLTVPSPSDAESLDAPLESLGRADAIYNRFVIEFEPPGSLRPSVAHSATRHAVAQVQQYMRGMESEHGLQLERVAGCAFDGNWIVYVRWERGEWRIAPPVQVDRDSLRALIETIASLATGRGLTAENLDEDFGRESECAARIVSSLSGLFTEGHVTGRGLSMLDQWTLDLGHASGPFSPGDLNEWRELCSSLGVSDDEGSSSPVLFSLQTYFSLVAKMAALVILEGATGHSLVDELVRGGGATAEAFRDLESGALTLPTKALNAVEPGVFSWYLGEIDDQLAESLTFMATTTNQYSAEVVEITPLVARDVLKDLFQRLLPRAIRHRLGEYYTPDWLSQRVINQVTGSMQSLDPRSRFLDPACGSGTFLVEIISRMVNHSTAADPRLTLEQILQNVVGFDLSPLAVQASKVNYLLALSPLIRKATQPIFLPVFLADSVSPPRSRGILEGDVLVFESSEGDWRVPSALAEAHYLPELGAVFEEGLAEGKDSDWLGDELQKRVPVVATEDRTVLDEAKGLYQKLVDLERVDRNGMWWHLVSNAFAPTLQGKFDYVVGNPPWVSWGTLPEPYRRANEDLWLEYQLRPDSPPDQRQPSANVQLDLSMLFVARCIDQYLVPGGKLGFVITASVFKSELAGRGFRRRHLPGGEAYRFTHIDDMTSLEVFEGATNQTSVLVAEKRPPRRSVIPVLLWRPAEGRRVPPQYDLEEVSGMTTRRELLAEPVSPLDDASPLIMMTRRGLEASRHLRQRSPYADMTRKGVDTRGANGIFFVEVLGEENGLVRVRNLAREGRNRDVPVIEGLVERQVLRSLLRGRDVDRGRAEPGCSIMLFHDEQHLSAGIPAPQVRTRFPQAFEYISNFEHFLRSRRTFRNFDPTGDGWPGMYSVTRAAVAEHKVVFRYIANGMICAAVHGSAVIPETKLNVIPCQSGREADLLATALDSQVVDYLVRAFSVSTSISGAILRYIGVRDLSQTDLPDDENDAIATALGMSPDEYRSLDAVARTEIGFLRSLAGDG